MRCLCLAAGSEFLLPVRGFFCLLCKVFSGDAICAEEHVTTHAHNEKYKVFAGVAQLLTETTFIIIFMFLLRSTVKE